MSLALFLVPYSILGLIILIIIGALIIWVAGILLAFLPAFIVAGVVWWITGNELLAGIGFLIVAIISLSQKKDKSNNF